MKAIVHIMATTGADWIKEHPHGSYAPVRENMFAQWWVNGNKINLVTLLAGLDDITIQTIIGNSFSTVCDGARVFIIECCTTLS